MTWTCPTCYRDYPDSGIGLPADADADTMTHCKVCDGVRERHNPESQDPYEVLADYPELIHHGMIRAFIEDSRRLDYWRPVHFDADSPRVKP